MGLPDIVNLQQQFDGINEHWQLKSVGLLNGQVVELAKLSGEFMWHSHENEDKLFQVVRGTLRINFRDGYRDIQAGEFIKKGLGRKTHCFSCGMESPSRPNGAGF